MTSISVVLVVVVIVIVGGTQMCAKQLRTTTRCAPDNMGCIAASSTAIVDRCGRHVPFPHHLGVPH